MRTPSCRNFDCAYDTFEGEKRIYCAIRGANVKRGECATCKDRDAVQKETAND